MSDKLNPIIKFKEWFDLATEKEINDPNAMCLSTVDDKNTPHSRMVLLKDYNDDDFILAMGDPVAIGISCIIASEVNNGKVNILKWDRENSCYYNVNIDMYQKGESNV